MIRTTPFHARLSELNDQHLYTHWQGTLSPLRYTQAPKHEYFAVRNGVGIFDTSPLFKYRITGPEAEAFLSGLIVRDITACRPGRAVYTLWCDDRGFVMQDGVAFRLSDNDFLLTSARPAMAWLTSHTYGRRVALEDVTDEFAMLAVQGPRSREVLVGMVPEVNELPYFGLAETKLGSTPVMASRTGYTGDLGFELTVPSEDAIAVLDAVLEAGRPHGLRPFGEEAMNTRTTEHLDGLFFTGDGKRSTCAASGRPSATSSSIRPTPGRRFARPIGPFVSKSVAGSSPLCAVAWQRSRTHDDEIVRRAEPFPRAGRDALPTWASTFSSAARNLDAVGGEQAGKLMDRSGLQPMTDRRRAHRSVVCPRSTSRANQCEPVTNRRCRCCPAVMSLGR